MVRFLPVLLACAAALSAAKYEKRLDSAVQVFEGIMLAPDQSIPQDLLNKAECIVIIPGAKKGAFIFGGKYGRGYASCRPADGLGWTAPGAVRMEGFNFGLQVGGSETDIVMLIMNQQGMRRLLTSRFTIGADAAAAAGPVGRTMSANTDAFLSAEILSWSRSRGVFAGVALDGATLREDLDVNDQLYGERYSNRDILAGRLQTPAAAKPLIDLLTRYSARAGRPASK